jgi:hypothetical protein
LATLLISALVAFLLDPVVVLIMQLKVPRPAAIALVIAITRPSPTSSRRRHGAASPISDFPLTAAGWASYGTTPMNGWTILSSDPSICYIGLPVSVVPPLRGP